MVPGPPIDPRLADPRFVKQQAVGRKLVTISRVAGWGGTGLIVLGVVFAGSGVLLPAVVVAAIGAVAAVAGAIVGQVGRAMQGRVI